MWQPAPRAWEEEPGRASTTRPPLKTTALSAVATHLVKASPRSITTAVFSPPLPRPSYSGMVVKTTVRRPRTQAPQVSALGGAGPGRRRAGVATAGASSGCGAPGPGCPWLCLTPRRIQILAGVPVSGTKEEETRAAADRGAGNKGQKRSGTPGAPSGAEPTGSFPLAMPLCSAGGGDFHCASTD